MNYGAKPKNLGIVRIAFKETCNYLYMPIKLMNSRLIRIPKRLQPFNPLINRVVSEMQSKEIFFSHCIYLTVKSGIITPGNPGNRPGYHSDGFMTKDINYIWSDCLPTIFNTSSFDLSQHEHISMMEMEWQALKENELTYPEMSLLRLTQAQIHKVPEVPAVQERCFVKISVSRDRYNLMGNTHNHDLKYDWNMAPRKLERNVPQAIISK